MALLSLLAKLGLDATGFNQGLKSASREADNFGTRVGASLKGKLAGAFTVGAAVQATRFIINHASKVQDLSEQYDITTTEVQRLSHALELGGLKFEDFGQAMDRFGALRKAAVGGDEKAIANFEQFGITMTDLEDPLNRNLDLIIKLSGALSKLALTAAQRADLREMFGRSGGRLLTTLKGGVTGAAPGEATPDQIALVESFGDKISAMWTGLKNTAVKIGSDILSWDVFGPGTSPFALAERGKFLDSMLKEINKNNPSSSTAPDLPLRILNGGAGFNDLFRGGAAAIPEKASRGFSVAGDSLANVGGFVGGAGAGGGGTVDILKQSLREQRASKEYLRDMAENKSTFG